MFVTVACASSRRLDAGVEASGPHDFAVRVSAVRLRFQAEDPIAPMLPRPPHPLPNVCDDRETPLCVGRDGGSSRSDLGLRRSGIFFAEGLDSKSVICPSGKSASLPGERKAAACEYSYVEEKRHGFQLWASRLRTILQPVPTTSNVIELHR